MEVDSPDSNVLPKRLSYQCEHCEYSADRKTRLAGHVNAVHETRPQYEDSEYISATESDSEEDFQSTHDYIPEKHVQDAHDGISQHN